MNQKLLARLVGDRWCNCCVVNRDELDGEDSLSEPAPRWSRFVVCWEVGVKDFDALYWWSEYIARHDHIFFAHENVKTIAGPR